MCKMFLTLIRIERYKDTLFCQVFIYDFRTMLDRHFLLNFKNILFIISCLLIHLFNFSKVYRQFISVILVELTDG